MVNDIFMQRVQEDGLWTLFDPYEVEELTIYIVMILIKIFRVRKKRGNTKRIISG